MQLNCSPSVLSLTQYSCQVSYHTITRNFPLNDYKRFLEVQQEGHVTNVSSYEIVCLDVPRVHELLVEFMLVKSRDGTLWMYGNDD